MIKLIKGNLIPTVRALLSILIVLTMIPPASATEETVSLSFKKVASVTGKENFYTVKKGEYLFKIIRDELGGASPKAIYRILREIKDLNPHIKNINIIYEGQKILLPERSGSSGKGILKQDKKVKKRSQTAAVATADKNFLKYTVKKGDQLYQIVRDHVNVSLRELHNVLEKIKKLNPHIRNINIIRPGDVLILPIKRKIPTVEEPISTEKTPLLPSKPFLPIKQELAVIGTVVGRMNGSIIQEGTFYIPLPPAGQISINCATVPVVEFDEGTTIFLDFSDRIPEALKSIIESTWKNYAFIRQRQNSEFPSLLEGVIRSSPSYTLNSVGKYTAIGNNPQITLFVDWTVSHRNGTDSFAIRFLRDRSSTLQESVKDYAREKGLEIMEIRQKRGLIETKETSSPRKLPAINNYETKPQLAESILSTMGYVFTRDSDIDIFDMRKDGFNLSIKTDFRLTVNGREILILFKKISKQFLDTLEGRGITVTTLSEDMEESTIVEGILNAIGVPFSRGSFSFPSVNERMEIRLPAIRAQSREGFLYLIDYDIDSKIYGLLHEKWKVKAVRY